MKKASDILNILQHKPQFSKLSSYRCIQKIESAFSKPLQKMIKFAYIKNNILFFVLNHPGAKQEFDNNIQSIKSALNMIKPQECQEIYIQDIRAFVTHSPIKIITFHAKKPQYYKERALGKFNTNTIKDPKLKALAEEIKEIIKHNHDT
jgi:hypothetical protein